MIPPTFTHTYAYSILSAAFNALCFLLLYRVFSAQVKLLEEEIMEARLETVRMRREMEYLKRCYTERERGGGNKNVLMV